MSRSSEILKVVNHKIDSANVVKENCTEGISVLDAGKEPYRGSIQILDKLLFDETNAINESINDVGAAYQARVDAGCRSDLLWRVIDYDPGDGTPSNPPEWTLECVRIEAGDYEKKSNTGIGSAFAFVEPNGTGGISSSHTNAANGVLQNIVGFQTDFYHGLKIFDEPYAANVTDTYVRGGVGTCGFGTTRLYFMSPTSAGTGNDPTDPSAGIKTGMLIQSNTIGILGGTYTEIVGVETAMIDMRRIDSGISTDSTEINVLTLETPTIGIASAPQPDGTYVDFIISKDPDSLEVEDWGIPINTPPYTPQTIKMMIRSSIGAGTSIAYDNSGEPNVIRTWNQFMLGLPDPNDFDVDVTRPEVGAGRSHYLIGFGSFPVISGSTAATLGQTKTVLAAELTNGSLYDDITTTCSTQQTNLVNAISTRDTLESALNSSMSTFNARLSLSNDIREDQNDLNIRIWGYRTQIGQSDADIDKSKAFKGVLNDTQFLDEINGAAPGDNS